MQSHFSKQTAKFLRVAAGGQGRLFLSRKKLSGKIKEEYAWRNPSIW